MREALRYLWIAITGILIVWGLKSDGLMPTFIAWINPLTPP